MINTEGTNVEMTQLQEEQPPVVEEDPEPTQEDYIQSNNIRQILDKDYN
jgi:poly(A) polymerase